MSRKTNRVLLGLTILSGLFLITPDATAAVDFFLKIDSPKGELSKTQIRATGLRYEEIKAPRDVATGQASGRREAASGMATGKRMHKPLVITKELDKASPLLMRAYQSSEVFPTVTLEFVGDVDGDGTADYHKIELHDVVITSIQAARSASRAARGTAPTEEVTFAYGKVAIDGADGTGQDLTRKTFVAPHVFEASGR